MVKFYHPTNNLKKKSSIAYVNAILCILFFYRTSSLPVAKPNTQKEPDDTETNRIANIKKWFN